MKRGSRFSTNASIASAVSRDEGSYGIRGLAMGGLPAGITSLFNEQIAIQDRVVEAAVHGDRAAALEALLLDPVSNRDASEAEAMLEELLAAHAELLPQFSGGGPGR